MLTESGRVVAVEEGALWVETIRKSTCGSCVAEKGCGHGILNRIGDGKRSYVRVLANGEAAYGLAVDDQVIIEIPEEVILRGSLVVYMWPLLGMLGGAALAATAFVGQEDALAAVGAIGGFLVGVAMVRWHAWRHRNDRNLQPVLRSVIRQTDLVSPLHAI